MEEKREPTVIINIHPQDIVELQRARALRHQLAQTGITITTLDALKRLRATDGVGRG